MFSGLCAFPLTPLHQQNFDEKAFIRILARLTDAGVDSLGHLRLNRQLRLSQP